MRNQRRPSGDITLMDNTELPLRDIHLPDVLSGSLAIGWWGILILIPLILFFCYWLFKRITRKTAVKTAKKLLKSLKIDESKNSKEKLESISALIRRVAISVNSRSECASLTGKSWLEFLDNSLGEKIFSNGAGQILITEKYQKTTTDSINIDELITLTERWLKAQK